jgi:hypothetical protein
MSMSIDPALPSTSGSISNLSHQAQSLAIGQPNSNSPPAQPQFQMFQPPGFNQPSDPQPPAPQSSSSAHRSPSNRDSRFDPYQSKQSDSKFRAGLEKFSDRRASRNAYNDRVDRRTAAIQREMRTDRADEALERANKILSRRQARSKPKVSVAQSWDNYLDLYMDPIYQRLTDAMDSQSKIVDQMERDHIETLSDEFIQADSALARLTDRFQKVRTIRRQMIDLYNNRSASPLPTIEEFNQRTKITELLELCAQEV